jgi:hypothetical protein
MEAERIVDEPEGESEERRAVKALLGGRMFRKRRMRRLLLTHLLRQGDEIEENEGDDEESDDRQVLRMLIGGRAMRRGKLRRLALTQFLRERDDDEGEEIDEEEGGSE